MTNQTRNTDYGNGFHGVRVNATLNAEIDRRWDELSKMEEQSDWTKEMVARGDMLQKEIDDLLDAKRAFEANF